MALREQEIAQMPEGPEKEGAIQRLNEERQARLQDQAVEQDGFTPTSVGPRGDFAREQGYIDTTTLQTRIDSGELTQAQADDAVEAQEMLFQDWTARGGVVEEATQEVQAPAGEPQPEGVPQPGQQQPDPRGQPLPSRSDALDPEPQPQTGLATQQAQPKQEPAVDPQAQAPAGEPQPVAPGGGPVPGGGMTQEEAEARLAQRHAMQQIPGGQPGQIDKTGAQRGLASVVPEQDVGGALPEGVTAIAQEAGPGSQTQQNFPVPSSAAGGDEAASTADPVLDPSGTVTDPRSSGFPVPSSGAPALPGDPGAGYTPLGEFTRYGSDFNQWDMAQIQTVMNDLLTRYGGQPIRWSTIRQQNPQNMFHAARTANLAGATGRDKELFDLLKHNMQNLDPSSGPIYMGGAPGPFADNTPGNVYYGGFAGTGSVNPGQTQPNFGSFFNPAQYADAEKDAQGNLINPPYEVAPASTLNLESGRDPMDPEGGFLHEPNPNAGSPVPSGAFDTDPTSTFGEPTDSQFPVQDVGPAVSPNLAAAASPTSTNNWTADDYAEWEDRGGRHRDMIDINNEKAAQQAEQIPEPEPEPLPPPIEQTESQKGDLPETDVGPILTGNEAAAAPTAQEQADFDPGESAVSGGGGEVVEHPDHPGQGIPIPDQPVSPEGVGTNVDFGENPYPAGGPIQGPGDFSPGVAPNSQEGVEAILASPAFQELQKLFPGLQIFQPAKDTFTGSNNADLMNLLSGPFFGDPFNLPGNPTALGVAMNQTLQKGREEQIELDEGTEAVRGGLDAAGDMSALFGGEAGRALTGEFDAASPEVEAALRQQATKSANVGEQAARQQIAQSRAARGFGGGESDLVSAALAGQRRGQAGAAQRDITTQMAGQRQKDAALRQEILKGSQGATKQEQEARLQLMSTLMNNNNPYVNALIEQLLQSGGTQIAQALGGTKSSFSDVGNLIGQAGGAAGGFASLLGLLG
jgi:hypothetical protein